MLNANTQPPKTLEFVLRFILDETDKESLCGDFAEIYAYRLSTSGRVAALGWYMYQVFKLIPIMIIQSLTRSMVMFANYFKIALRNLLKQKAYSFINISGLALGTAACLMILLYLKSELSYDKHNEHSAQIYRLERQSLGPDGGIRRTGNTLAPSFTLLLEKDFPEFENIVRLYHSPGRVEYEKQSFREQNIFYAEHDLFEVFTLPMIAGDPATALANPFSIVLSRSTAEKYFGTANPLGKKLTLLGQVYDVTGIVEDTPKYAHIHFDLIPSYLSLRGYGGSYNIKDDYFLGADNFSDNVTYTYARISKNSDAQDLYAKIPEFLDSNIPAVTFGDGRTMEMSKIINIGFRNIRDIHIRADGATDIEPTTDAAYILLFSIVAGFILLIACINFVNLSTARGSKRAREVGLRSVVGATRGSMITQFIGESLFLAFIAIIFAVVVVAFTLPYLNVFMRVNLSFGILLDPYIIAGLLATFLISGILSGLYPAFYLTSFNPVSILRGELTKGKKGAAFRKILVVFQFTVSAALIMCVLIIFKQMHFMQNKNLGFDKENVVIISAERNIRNHYDAFKQELLANANVLSVTASKRAPFGFLADAPGYTIELNGEVRNSPFNMPHNRVWHDFFKTYKMEIVAGRDISQLHPTDDSLAYVLNETACLKLGIDDPRKVIGAKFKAAGNKQGQVIGVVKDFNYETLRNDIKPIVTYISGYVNTLAIRVAPADFNYTIKHIEQVYSKYNPGTSLEYTFLDARMEALYRNEADMMELFGYFSIFALVIGSLGLFGLAAFTVEQKIKEIGIRKTLGASVHRLTFALSYQFTRWIIIANIIAYPLVYYFMSNWLTNFSYRTQVGVLVLAISLVVSLLIGIITVSSQTYKAACRNPVQALRME